MLCHLNYTVVVSRSVVAVGRILRNGGLTVSAPITASKLPSSFANMDKYHIDQFTRGWIVGDFQPRILGSNDVEVGIRHYRRGDSEAAHYHKVATELTAVVSGQVRMFGRDFGPGEIIRVNPGEATGFEALTDAVTVVVKQPSVSGDKYLDNGS